MMDIIYEILRWLNLPEKYLIAILMLTGYAVITLFQIIAKKFLKTNPILTTKIIFVIAGTSLLFYIDFFASFGIDPLYIILASVALIVAGTYSLIFRASKAVVGGIRHG